MEIFHNFALDKTLYVLKVIYAADWFYIYVKRLTVKQDDHDCLLSLN